MGLAEKAKDKTLTVLAQWQKSQGARLLGALCLILPLLVAATAIIYVTGGTGFAYVHVLYIPILIGGFFFGVSGGLMVGLLAGLAVGPWMPVNVETGLLQSTVNWGTRLAFFSLIGCLAGLMCRILATQLEEGRRRQNDLNRANEALEAIISSAPVAIYTLDTDERVTSWNSAAEAIFGFAEGEVLGRRLSTIPPENQEQFRAIVARAIRGEVLRDLDVLRQSKDGRQLQIRLSAAPLYDRADGLRGVLYIAEDVTEHRNVQRQLSHAQKMEAIGQLTGGLAHDFNNLLTVVIGNLELLEDYSKENAVALEAARRASEASMRGAQLTRQLLAFSRKQALSPKAIDLNVVVTETAALLQRTIGESIELEVRCSTGIWPAQADRSQVESALANFVINARDAMPSGGRLVIETGNAHLDADYAAENSEVASGDYVMMAVADNGTGIAPEVLERVFEPFFTTKEADKGTGLGLSMVYGFAKQSGGHVKIYSEVGHGTMVRLYLPRATAGEAVIEQEPAGTSTLAVKGRMILVVEDKGDVREIAVRELVRVGYRVLQADNPLAALAILDQTEGIDVLFTDVIMPGGMTGVDLAREARKHRPGLRVLYTSGFSDALADTGHRGRKEALLTKPYRRQELAAKLSELLMRESEGNRGDAPDQA